MIDDEGAVYEVRFGWTRRTVVMVAVLVGCAAYVPFMEHASYPWQMAVPMAMRVVMGLICLFGAGVLALVARSHAVAFRAGPEGVTLGGPLQRGGKVRVAPVIPWSEIERIVLFEQDVSDSVSMPYIGVVRTWGRAPDAPLTKSDFYLSASTGQNPDLAAASTAVNLWKLDVARLVVAVARNAPEVRVDDRTTPGKHRGRILNRDTDLAPKGRFRSPANPRLRVLVWLLRVAAPLLGIGCVVAAAPHIGGAWSAHFGHGRPGSLTITSPKHGDFVSDDGTVRLTGVKFGSGGAEPAAPTQRAVFTGDQAYVYPVGGGPDWLKMSAVLVLGVAILGGWAATTGRAVAKAVADRRGR